MALCELASSPALLIADYRLNAGRTGIEAIEHLRERFRECIPAFLISGDTAPELLRQVQASGHHMLYKPVTPMALRAVLLQFLHRDDRLPMWRDLKRAPQDIGSVKPI